MSQRRARQAASAKRGAIAPAPVEEKPAEAPVAAVAETPDPSKEKKQRVSDDDVLNETFEWLESNGIIGGEADAKTLGDMQKAFAIDQLRKPSEVADWNAVEIDGKKVSSWKELLQYGYSYYAPFPGDLVFYPENTAKMHLRFDQANLMTRQSEMLVSQVMNGLAEAMVLEPSHWKDLYPGIAHDRKDAHIIVYGIHLRETSTKHLPHTCNLHFFTGTSDANMLREWHTDPDHVTASMYGNLKHTVVEPCAEYRTFSPMPIFKCDVQHLTNPWMSRFMTFNFDQYKIDLNRDHKNPKDPDFYVIKAPALDTAPDKFTPSQWLVMTFYRYLHYVTKAEIKKRLEANAVETEKKIGTTVMQTLDKEAKELQWAIYKPAFDKLLERLHKKVQAASVMANLEKMVVALTILGGRDSAEQLLAKMDAQRELRDQLERDAFVGPLSFTLEVDYIAIPKDYPTMASQTEAETAAKFHPYHHKAHTSGGFSFSYGKYGTHHHKGAEKERR